MLSVFLIYQLKYFRFNTLILFWPNMGQKSVKCLALVTFKKEQSIINDYILFDIWPLVYDKYSSTHLITRTLHEKKCLYMIML